MNIDFTLDFETLATSEDAVVLSLAFLPFEREGSKSFEEYLDSCYYWKFEVDHQVERGRAINQSTLDWWSKQDKEVQDEQLLPSDIDLKLEDVLIELIEVLRHHGINRNSIGWARGKEFDFGIMSHIVKETKQFIPKEDVLLNETYFPTPFWNRRDIRDYIAGLMVDPTITKVPLPKDTLTGFKHHDPIHDCARAVMHIKYAEMYARGELEIPDEVDPNSNK